MTFVVLAAAAVAGGVLALARALAARPAPRRTPAAPVQVPSRRRGPGTSRPRA